MISLQAKIPRAKLRNRALIDYLSNSPLTMDQKRIALKFVSDMNRCRFGDNIGRNIRNNIIAPRKIKRINNWATAVKLLHDDESNRIGDGKHDELMLSPDAYFTAFIAREIIMDFGNLGYHTKLWAEFNANATSALVEHLLCRPGYFSQNWKIFANGHYICGYSNKDSVFVY